jgi:hypothetical protein
MDGYVRVLLKEMIKEVGEDRVKSILSGFLCPINKDVEGFLKQKAIEFDKQGISSTHLIFTSFKSEPVLIGYFALANKCIDVPIKKLSSNMRKRMARFGPRHNDNTLIQIALPLIAQLGKNYAEGYNKLISGDELLKIAIEQIQEVQRILSGKFTYLECEDTPKLKEFYSSNGFVEFSERPLDEEETAVMKGSRLVQMIRYIG